MILDELYLHNFCLYKGLHRFALAPVTSNGSVCPITLFGGMNGAGKTTILDAVQLALYGARARTANRLGKSYEEYLRECIHRGVPSDEGASVSIKFQYHAEGQRHSYEVWRGWSLKEKAVRERVRVTKNEVLDTFLSEHWNDVVEELIPVGISQLFFFDAEKIRFLADDDTDTAALGAAIKSLLGLDLAERLIADASIVEKRLTDKVLDREDDGRAHQLQVQLEKTSAQLAEMNLERGSIENRLLRAIEDQKKANAEFAAGGGEHWRRRSDIQAQLHGIKVSVDEIQSQLRELASSELPLALVPRLLKSTRERDAREVESKNADLFNGLLVGRDKAILKELRTVGLGPTTVRSISSVLAADRKRRHQMTDQNRIIDLSGQSRAALVRLGSSAMDEQRDAVNKLLRKLKALECAKENYLRLLNAAPDDETISDLVEKVRSCAELVGNLEATAKRLDIRLAGLRRERDDLDAALAEIRKELVHRHIDREESLRMAALAQKTQSVMKDYLRRATAHKIERLSQLVTQSFRFLLHKETLVGRVQIHPESFKIDLFGEDGKLLPKSRLSEGEKQIFAVAVLWGLAQASPRQLPAIIDTPMARLDSDHRSNLVERYFPNASHQVIILSTDTEVEASYFDRLQSRIARSYHLRYDDDNCCTTAVEGYFWQAVPTEAKV